MYLAGLGVYYLKNGQPASVLYVGDTMGFNVPGYSSIWLEQTQNGTTQYSGPFNLPMAPYTLLPRDAGNFQASIYELTAAGTRGKLIGTDSIQVLAAATTQAAAPIMPPPTVQQIPAPGYVNPGPTSSGGSRLPTGIATPSSPSILFTPAPPMIFQSPTPSEAPTGEPVEAGVFGMSPLALLLIAGLGIGLLMKRR